MMEETNALHVERPDLLLPELAPGVRGYMVEHEGVLHIPIIVADTPGNGDTGRYLDSLPRDRALRVPNIFSVRLACMLRRRGFTLVFVESGWDAVRSPST